MNQCYEALGTHVEPWADMEEDQLPPNHHTQGHTWRVLEIAHER